MACLPSFFLMSWLFLSPVGSLAFRLYISVGESLDA